MQLFSAVELTGKPPFSSGVSGVDLDLYLLVELTFIRFAAYAVAYSPFVPNKLAVAGAANFGLVGNGRLSLLGIGPNGMAVNKVLVLSSFS